MSRLGIAVAVALLLPLAALAQSSSTTLSTSPGITVTCPPGLLCAPAPPAPATVVVPSVTCPAGQTCAVPVVAPPAPPAPSQTSVDLSAIENQILSALGIVLVSGLGYFGTVILSKINNTALSTAMAGNAANLQAAANAALAYGITRADATIKAKGWDHAEVKTEVLKAATPYLLGKFSETLANSGVDVKNVPASEAAVQGLLERSFPAAATVAAASPATPPAPATAQLPAPIEIHMPAPIVVPAPSQTSA
jgi:hypothetical protein